jgi:hypothetical protein
LEIESKQKGEEVYGQANNRTVKLSKSNGGQNRDTPHQDRKNPKGKSQKKTQKKKKSLLNILRDLVGSY